MDLKKLYIERALYPAMELLGNNRVKAYTRELIRSEGCSMEERRGSLRQKLTELMGVCCAQVPAYSGLPFSELELRREPVDCLRAVDPVTLADFLADPDAYLRRDVDVTGLQACYCDRPEQTPARIYLTQSQIERYEAARWRGLSWYGVTMGSPSVYLWDRPHAPFVLQEEPYLHNRLAVSVCAMTERTVHLTAQEIDRFAPEYLTGSTTSLDAMARAMEQTGVRLQTPLKVVTLTRGIAEAQLRQRLSAVFGCPVAQVLGGKMEGIMAYMCPEGHLHITAEHCFVEILDPGTWTPVPPGQRGLVAVTNLLDETMPHLRVILNCMAAMPETPCPCGRTLPILTQVQAIAPA